MNSPEWDNFCKKVEKIPKCKKINYIPKVKIQPKKRYIMDSILDLHNYTLQESYIKVNEFIETFEQQPIKNVSIITGKSGKIKEEFCEWTKNTKLKISNINEGSFRLIKKKK